MNICVQLAAQKHGDSQALAGGLPGKELALAIGQMSALAVMLRVSVCEETGAQKYGVLAVLLPQRIHTLVQV
jgi:hypothetical protein